MKLIHHAWQNPPLVCLENLPGPADAAAYETMNHLLADRPDHRAGVLEKAGKGSWASLPGGGPGARPHSPSPAGCDLPGDELSEAQDGGRAV